MTPKRTWLVAVVAVAAIGAAVAAVFVAATGNPPRGRRAAGRRARARRITAVAPMGNGPRQPVFEVRIDAPAGAQVLAAGAGMVVCAAPCSVAIDPADGGSTIRRDFVVRKAGFADRLITIDLTDPPVALEVSLEPLTATTATSPRSAIAAGRATATAAAPRSRRPSPSSRRPWSRLRPWSSPLAAADAGAAPPPTDKGKKPRKPPAVDPSTTIDPFAPKK